MIKNEFNHKVYSIEAQSYDLLNQDSDTKKCAMMRNASKNSNLNSYRKMKFWEQPTKKKGFNNVIK